MSGVGQEQHSDVQVTVISRGLPGPRSKDHQQLNAQIPQDFPVNFHLFRIIVVGRGMADQVQIAGGTFPKFSVALASFDWPFPPACGHAENGCIGFTEYGSP